MNVFHTVGQLPHFLWYACKAYWDTEAIRIENIVDKIGLKLAPIGEPNYIKLKSFT